MGNRGSKSSVSTGRKAIHISEFVRTVVKEQRVYGGCMELNGLNIKMYSNGSQKRLSKQNPF
jgi:hypothetical protein